MNHKITQFIHALLKAHQLPGLAVGVVSENRAVYAAGFGVRDLRRGNPVSEQSLFHLASISKLFVAAAVLQLVEQGRVRLEDPVIRHIPDFKLKSQACGEITIQHLLTHTAGMSDITDYHWDAPEYDSRALQRFVRSLAGDALLTPPGEVFAYSNTGFEVLGYLVARVSGTTFERYVQQHILRPCGMRASTHFRRRVPAALAVTPHLRTLTPTVSPIYPYHRAHAPSSTLHSSAVEMNAWAIANLNRGQAATTRILEPETYAQLWRPRAPTHRSSPIVQSIGLGWFLGEHRGQWTASHSGGDVGFTSQFILLPEAGIGVTVLCNAVPAPVREIALDVLDLALGFEPAPIPPSIMLPLGKAYLEGGLEALKVQYEKLSTEVPQVYDCEVGRFLETVEALLDSGQNSAALDLVSFALELEPQNAKGYELLSRAHFQEGNFEAALQAARRSLELEPENRFLRQQVERVMGEES